jgi:hypothetical protein
MGNKPNEFSKLNSLAKMAGVNIETAIEELKTEIVERIKPLIQASGAGAGPDLDTIVAKVIEKLPPPQPQIDIAALSKQISLDVETKVAVKLAEAIDALSKSGTGGKIDTNAVIQGVATILQPTITDATNKAAEAVFQANSQALMAELYKQLDVRIEQFNSQMAENFSQGQMPAQGAGPMQQQRGGGMDMTQILEILKTFMAPQQQQSSTTEIVLRAWLQGLSAGNKMKIGETSPEQLLSNVDSILHPGTPPPAAGK